MFRSTFRKLLFLIQKILLITSWYFLFFLKANQHKSWVVGVGEVASMLKNMSKSLSYSISVRLYTVPYYDFSYDFDWAQQSILAKIKRILISPILLAYLARTNNGFIYLASEGFLLSHSDAREFEFSFLKSKNKKVICVFLGSEIRSYKLLDEYSKNKSMDMLTTYERFVCLGIDSDEKELHRKKLAEIADKYADEIINAQVDQMSYFKKKTSPFLYFYPDEHFNLNVEKWEQVDKLKVFHAPSSPIIKGTQLVRAAVKKLQEEGYVFDYVEMSGVPHDKILEELKSTHIVLNQFYALIPGVFGIEAMASGCVLLNSATSELETSLPKDSDEAWIVTPYWLVYDQLKKSLDMPTEQLKNQALLGYKWSNKHCSYSSSAKQLDKMVRRC